MTTLTIYLYSIILGALHAFEPGHGKTLIAAYMVGTKGRTVDGVLLGTIVTITHTFSVILLGIVAMLLSKTYSDQVLHNWLGLVSAGLILIVGIWMMRQRLSGSGHAHFHLFGGHHHHHPHDEHSHEHHHPPTHNHTHDKEEEHGHGHQHEHPHPHEHSHEHHHPHMHPHEHDGYHEHNHELHEHAAEATPHTHHEHGPVAAKATSKLELLLLGMSGGLIPCPAAIATLLAAIAAGKIAQGLSVTLFFSLGLGGVMITIGVLLSQSRRLTNKISDNMDMARKLGIASAALIIALGSYTMFQSIRNIWF